VTPASTALLAALHLADGALPIGRFVHSAGLEVLLDGAAGCGDAAILEMVRSHVTMSAAPLDGVFVAAAHRAARAPLPPAERVAGLVALDRMLTVRRPSPVARAASRSCGRRLAAIGPGLVGGAPAGGEDVSAVLAALADRVAAGTSDGNLAVVSGAAAAAMGVGLEDAVVVEVRSAAAGLLSAAVRLGRLPASRAHVMLAASGPWLAAAARDAVATPVADASSSAFELDIAMLRRRRSSGWTFAS
jgi:urease accessory protein